MNSLLTIIAVGSGGAFGALLRMYTNGFVNSKVEHTIPFGTLSVNLIGSFAIGLLFAYFHTHPALPQTLKSFLITGVLGALTTYSTFAIESFFLIEAGEYFHAILNISLNLFGTIALASAGYMLVIYLQKVN